MGHHFQESMRKIRRASLEEICKDYVATLKANGRDKRNQAETRLEEVQEILGPWAAPAVTVQKPRRKPA